MASPIEGEKAPKAAVSAASKKAWSTDLKFGRYKAAITALDAALSAKDLDDEQRAVALINRGLALQQLKKYKQAVRDYSAALKFDALAAKTRATVIYNRGIAYHKLKRAALAIEDFTNALYLNVEFSHAYYARGRLMQEVGRHEFALADFKMAMKYHYPSPHLPFYGQALAYQSTQQKAKARKALSRALLLKPDFKPALDRYAELTGTPYSANGFVLPASKISPIIAKRETAVKSRVAARNGRSQKAQGDLPKAVAPTPELMAAAGGAEKLVGVDPIVTGSIPKAVQTAQKPVETKLPFRYPGMVGATKPVPTKTPKMVMTDLRPQAQKKAKNAAGPVILDPAQTTISEPPAEITAQPGAGTQLASLGGAGELSSDATAPEQSPETETEQLTGWFIQLNAQRSEDAAKQVWEKYKAKYGRALKGTQVVYQRADLGDKGIYWRVRLGAYDDRSSAHKKCRWLKRSGLRCFVVRAG
ncbi:MAG: SPOR domain-containing protein [Pseudomonadota bacterium]